MALDSIPTELLGPFAIFLLSLAFLCAIFFLLATLGGWRALAGSYPNLQGHLGKRYWMESGMLRDRTRYGGVLILSGSNEGLALSLWLPYRVGSPPILLPWSDIEVSSETSFLTEYAHITTQKQPDIPLRVRATTYRRIQEQVGDIAPALA